MSAQTSPAGEIPVIEGIELTGTALTITNEKLPWGDWETALRRLVPLERGASWWVGDLLAAGEKRYGETYVAAAKATGLSARYLRNLASVARSVPPENREPGLAWRAHREVAPLRLDEQREWLQRAAERGWTSDELARELRGDNSNGGPPNGDWPDPEAGDSEPVVDPPRHDYRCPCGCGYEWSGNPRPPLLRESA